ncbi:NUDIX domain-containing protein [Pseudonocardia artemisiae]|nr:NUDIX domain-containing protein [Pseudonocardia bannensis]
MGRGADLLVSEGHDPIEGQAFYRPLGGGVEFGEPVADALRREMREELAVELDGIEPVGVLENIVTYAGCPGARDRPGPHRRPDGPVALRARRRRGRARRGRSGQLAAARGVPRRHRAVYPEGLLDLLDRHECGRPPTTGA